MSRKRNGSKGGDFTRAEFLGVGAAAGAGLAISSSAAGGLEEVVQVSDGPAFVTSECPTSLDWAIGVSHLSALWSDLIPRVVAARWGFFPPDSLTLAPELPKTEGEMINDRVVSWIDWFLTEQKDGGDLGTQGFRERLEQLRAYLTMPLVGGNRPVAPIIYRATGGFDFVLSNDGIDVYLPDFEAGERSSLLAQLLYFFTIRETGRPVLGTPGVEARDIMPAKTGASQISTDDPASALMASVLTGEPANVCGVRDRIIRSLDELFRPLEIWDRSSPHGDAGLEPIDHQDVPDPPARAVEFAARQVELGRLLAAIGRTFPDEFGDLGEVIGQARAAWTGAAVSGDGDLVEQRRAWWEERRDQVIGLMGPEPTECEVITDDDLVCETRHRRCWQLEGSVFRGIAEQHPRLVAQKWFEVVNPSGNFPTTPTPFDPADTLSDVAREMADRLETALPNRMRIATEQDLGRPAWFQDIMGMTSNGAPTPRGVGGQLTVSNLGLHFPVTVPPGTTDSDEVEVRKNSFLGEIVRGNAGNPVFTDSGYCDF